MMSDVMDGKAYARVTDPAESVQAADSVDVPRGRRIVLRAFYQALLEAGEDDLPQADVTDEMVYGYCQRSGWLISPSGCRTRRHELQEAGYIMQTRSIPTFSGRKAATRMLTPAGVALCERYARTGWGIDPGDGDRS